MSQESDLRAGRPVIKEPLAPVLPDQGPEYQFIHMHCWGDHVLSGAQVQVHFSEVCDTAVCTLCQQPIHPVPYVFHETVQFRPHFGQIYIERGRKYALVLGVQWYGQWVIDVQHLRQHEYDPEFLELTPVKEYMVPAYAVERAPFQWSPTTNRRVNQAQATGVSREHAIEYLRRDPGIAHALTFVYSNPHFNVDGHILTGRAYATYPGQDGFMVIASLFQQDDLRVYVPLSDIVEIHIHYGGALPW